jgi:hypothetical protein
MKMSQVEEEEVEHRSIAPSISSSLRGGLFRKKMVFDDDLYSRSTQRPSSRRAVLRCWREAEERRPREREEACLGGRESESGRKKSSPFLSLSLSFLFSK